MTASEIRSERRCGARQPGGVVNSFVVVPRCEHIATACVRTECRAGGAERCLFRELPGWGRLTTHQTPSGGENAALGSFVERPYCQRFASGMDAQFVLQIRTFIKHPLGVRGSSGTRHLSVCNIPGTRDDLARPGWAHLAHRVRCRGGRFGCWRLLLRATPAARVSPRPPAGPPRILSEAPPPSTTWWVPFTRPSRVWTRATWRHVHSDDCPWRRARAARWFRRQHTGLDPDGRPWLNYGGWSSLVGSPDGTRLWTLTDNYARLLRVVVDADPAGFMTAVHSVQNATFAIRTPSIPPASASSASPRRAPSTSRRASTSSLVAIRAGADRIRTRAKKTRTPTSTTLPWTTARTTRRTSWRISWSGWRTVGVTGEHRIRFRDGRKSVDGPSRRGRRP